jgi:hypothetical protein
MSKEGEPLANRPIGRRPVRPSRPIIAGPPYYIIMSDSVTWENAFQNRLGAEGSRLPALPRTPPKISNERNEGPG